MTIKDSGQRLTFESGMERDTEDGKVDYSLIFDGPMLERWAAHMTKGAEKYTPRNWMKASGKKELARFRKSAFRHFVQAMRGDTDEDHFAAVFFNLNGMAYVQEQLKSESSPSSSNAPVTPCVPDRLGQEFNPT